MHIFLVALAMWVVYHQKHQAQEPVGMLLSLARSRVFVPFGVRAFNPDPHLRSPQTLPPPPSAPRKPVTSPKPTARKIQRPKPQTLSPLQPPIPEDHGGKVQSSTPETGEVANVKTADV